MKFSYLPLLLLLAVTGCEKSATLGDYPLPPSAGVGSSMTSASDVVRTGDKLEVYVLEDESFNGIYTVRDGGHIIFPKVGRVLVAGKSLSEVEMAVKQAFEGPAQQLRKATIIIERHGMRTEGPSGPTAINVYLSGNVNRPGGLSVPFIDGQHPTVYQAIVHGGGAADFAKVSKTHIIRNTGSGRTRIDADLKAIGAGKAQDIPIQNGDIIVVPAKGFLF